MDTIRCTIPTYLKKNPLQARFLASNQKKEVKPDKIYGVEKYSFDYKSGHYHITLTHQAGDWYIFPEHWYMTWEDGDEILERKPDGDVSDQPFSERPELKGKTNIQWNNFQEQISKYFTVGEVTRNDIRRIPTDLMTIRNIYALAKELDKVREEWGSPIIVTSWYRPPGINKAVGGATNSQHIRGSAVDIYPANGNLLALQRWLDKEAWVDKALGYGAPRGFVHLDMRKGNIRWNY